MSDERTAERNTNMATIIDVAVIKKIANHLAEREELMLEKQQWRDSEDRLRGYKIMRVGAVFSLMMGRLMSKIFQDARAKWIEAATKTHESIVAAKIVSITWFYRSSK
jgi:hypothetical protein